MVFIYLFILFIFLFNIFFFCWHSDGWSKCEKKLFDEQIKIKMLIIWKIVVKFFPSLFVIRYFLFCFFIHKLSNCTNLCQTLWNLFYQLFKLINMKMLRTPTRLSTLNWQWRVISSWKFDLFMDMDIEVGTWELRHVALYPLINQKPRILSKNSENPGG